MIIYKTTFPNGKIYIGQSTYNDEQYFGSGVICSRALKKFGKENCKKEILRECETQKQLDFFEAYYIKKFNSTNKEIGYNILPGTANKFGSGSPMLINEVRIRAILKIRSFHRSYKGFKNSIKHSKFLKGRFVGENNPNFGNYWNEEQKDKMRQKMLGRYNGENNPNFGNKLSNDNKNKISKKLRDYYDTKEGVEHRNRSAEFMKKLSIDRIGTKWITNGKENTVIHKDSPLPDGWRYGLTTKKMLQRNEDNRN